jgi:ribokinase
LRKYLLIDVLMNNIGNGKELRDFLKGEPKACKVALLPDFFLDRLINLDWTPNEFSSLIYEVANRKGGSIDGVPQTDIRGGNAINVSAALASLCANVTPIVCTSEAGLRQIEHAFKEHPIDLSHIKIRSKASTTTALELKSGNEKINVMIRDLGSLADFGSTDIDEEDWRTIETADYACLFNWAGTQRHGTELAQAIFSRTKAKGKSKTYYDTADPSPNIASAPELIEKVLRQNTLDILSVNENEAVIYASLLDQQWGKKRHGLAAGSVLEAARILASHLSARIDLHTSSFSASLSGQSETVVPTFRVNVLRATGAGDAWTAGNIIGDRNGLSDECRLLLANAVSACYLVDPEGKHPTWSKLAAFLNENS